MKKSLLLVVFLCLTTAALWAQRVGIGTNLPHNSAMLHVNSSDGGLLIPRMTQANRDAIAAPATGLLVFQTDNAPGFYYYDGAGWAALADHLGNHIMKTNLVAGSNVISRLGNNLGTQFLAGGGLSIRTRHSTNGFAVEGEGFRMDSLGNLLAVGRALDNGSVPLVGKIPAEGAGTRFMWYPSRGSLRFGRVPVGSSTDWDEVNMDDFTFAGGNNVRATSYGAFAFGDQVFVNSVVGVGFGSGNVVNGTAAFTAGASNTANGFAGVAIGYASRANGQGSVALGYRVSAANDYSVALGYRATNNGFTGTMVMGDESTTDSVRNTADNQFVARYAGGYRFYTKATTAGTANTGVFLSTNANAWGSISDSTKKENFLEADKEYFLEQLAGLRLGSWSYKDDGGNRHYGPMAQEIFAAYGRDAFGVIGCDTVLTTADMDGMMMIMLQGLEKRTAMHKEENRTLKAQLSGLHQQVAKLEAENQRLKEQGAALAQLQQQVLALQKLAVAMELAKASQPPQQ